MARPVASRLIAEGWLVAVGALHVGAAEPGTDSDLPLARDGQGRHYLPGTSLTGAFRAWTCRTVDPDQAGQDVIDAAWGYQRPSEDSRHTDGAASRITVEDAVVELPGGLTEELRDGVGIDREHGGAAPHVKYDRAVLPPGTRARLRVTAELPPDPAWAAGVRGLVGHLLAGLREGELRLGAAQTRGLGHVRLEELTVREQDLATLEGMLAALQDGGAPVGDVASLLGGRVRQSTVDVEVVWHPHGPVMVRDAADGFAVDALPLAAAAGSGQMALLLPGSTVKGALRAQAERIVRTVRRLELGPSTDSAPARPRPTERFLHQVQVPLVDWLFGAAATRQPAAPTPPSSDGARPPGRGRGAFAVDDCVAVDRLDADGWQAVRAAADDQALDRAMARAGAAGWSHGYHVAVDRWTGGAATGLLYSALEPHGVGWAPIRGRLDTARLPDAATGRAALALLLLVLGDLAAGRLPLGFGGNRGFGAVSVDELRLTIHDPAALELPGVAPLQVRLPGGSLDGLPGDLRERLEASWVAWIDRADSPGVPEVAQ